MVREEGEATRCSCTVGMAVVVFDHFDPHLAGSYLAGIGRAEDCFCRL